MAKIISVSRRTDIPAFYGDWFMNCLKQGQVGYIGPRNMKKILISLALKDVICLVFWSKNYIPFAKHLPKLQKMGYKFYFNFTITGLPKEFETNLCELEQAIEMAKKLSCDYFPKSINWRYDRSNKISKISN